MADVRKISMNGQDLYEEGEKIGFINGNDIYIDPSALGGGSAEDITFDNTDTELVSEDVQSAIEEIDEKVESVDSALTDNDNHFYYMELDGVSGWTLDEERSEESFHPFISGGSITDVIDTADGLACTESSMESSLTTSDKAFLNTGNTFDYFQSDDEGGTEWCEYDFNDEKTFKFVKFKQIVAQNVDNVAYTISASTDGIDFTDVVTIPYAETQSANINVTARFIRITAEIEVGKCMCFNNLRFIV